MREEDIHDYNDNKKETKKKEACKQVWNPQINQSINKVIYVCI